MIQAAEALEIIKQAAEERTPHVQAIALEECQGLALAEDIIADRDYPPFHRAAMDGFAVRLHELERGNVFPVASTIFAGQQSLSPIAAGHAVKIMTGAALPETFDAVVRVEDSVIENGFVRLCPAKTSAWLNVAQRAEDAVCTDVVVPRGARIGASVLSAAAACGYAKLKVYAQPSVHIITTGNEIKDVESNPGPAEIRNSNKYTLMALCRHSGIRPQIYHCPDDSEALTRRIRESTLHADVVLLTGGVSAGDADYVPGAAASCGILQRFHKVNIRPGKPVYFGTGEALVFGLPGNPVSCHVTARVFVEPALCTLMRLRETKETIKLAHAVTKKHGMQEYLRVRKDQSGRAVKTPHNGSGDFFASTRSDGLAVLPAESGSFAENTEVEYLAFGW